MNSKRRCTMCKGYFTVETMWRVGEGSYPSYCTKDCQDAHYHELVAQRDARKVKQKKKNPFNTTARRKSRNEYRSGGASTELRRAVRNRDGDMCRRCGDGRWLHVHHIAYRSEGGPNTKGNLITLCEDCHDWAHANKRERKPLLLAYIWLLYAEGRQLMLNDVRKVVDERKL